MSDYERLYPDVVAAKGLANALRAALNSIDSGLEVTRQDTAVNSVAYAQVVSGLRSSQVFIAANERFFLFDGWNHGVKLIDGATPDLAELAKAINRWVGSDCTAATLGSEFEFVTPDKRAVVYERGGEVDDHWQNYPSYINEHLPELTEFVTAAARRDELRQLFPYTSLNRFCFSRCTGYPFTRDIPHVNPLPGGGYRVIAPDGKELGRGNGEQAADLVVRNLRSGCGPAVAGTEDDLIAD